MNRHLILDLEAPLMSFGSISIGEVGPTDELPGPSFLTGLLANALGYDRSEGDLHDALQSRLVFGAALVRRGSVVIDFQTSRLDQKDGGWTTSGQPYRRAGSPTYAVNPDEFRRTGREEKVRTSRRWRHARADSRVIVALRLDDADHGPDLDRVSEALLRPARPLFLGRKPFMPSRRILAGEIEARTVRGALWEWLLNEVDAPGRLRARWSASEGGEGRTIRTNQTRDWTSGVHAGGCTLLEGTLG